LILTRCLCTPGRQVAAALSLYHIPAAIRGATRIWGGEQAFGGAMGGPGVHLVLHSIAFLGLAGLAVFGGVKGGRAKTS
jgi:hypothetical protein